MNAPAAEGRLNREVRPPIDELLFENVAALDGSQPSNAALVSAYNEARFGDAAALAGLSRLRNGRSSWLGKDENALRRAIDSIVA